LERRSVLLALDPVWITATVCYAEAAIEVRDPKYAGPVFDRLAPWADQLPCNGATMEGPSATISVASPPCAVSTTRRMVTLRMLPSSATRWVRDPSRLGQISPGKDAFGTRLGEKAPGLLDVFWGTARPLWIRPRHRVFALAYGVPSLVLTARTDDTDNTLSQILG